MKHLVLLLAVLPFVSLGCSRTDLRLHEGWVIQPPPEKEGNVKQPVVLQPGGSVVLAISREERLGTAMDARALVTVLIEVPSDSLQRLPCIIRDPRAVIAEAWCLTPTQSTKERATCGTVLIQGRASDGVRATVDMSFPSHRVQKSGVFKLRDRPGEWRHYVMRDTVVVR